MSIVNSTVHTHNELKDQLRKITEAYNKELHLNGLTGKLEELSVRKENLKSKISRGIYI